MNFSSVKQDSSPKIERRVSQGQLNVLQTCPRKFQYTYLEKSSAPIAPEQQTKIAWGNRFHLLMQQRELGLPVESLLQEDPVMERCYRGLLDAAPELFHGSDRGNDDVFREAEHCRTLQFFNGYLLVAVYDLLIAEKNTAKILDWKTYPLPTNPRYVEENWQTKLYPFLFAETSDYLPEQISMSYWFVRSAGNPEFGQSSLSLRFAYNTDKHDRIRQQLARLLNKLTEWLQAYEERGEPFPQVPVRASGLCQGCPFAIRCQRSKEGKEATLGGVRVPSLAEIDEVTL
jgi:hypothetical protein